MEIHHIIAQDTELGWIVSGNMDKTSHHNIVSAYFISAEEKIDNLLKKFWEI